MEYPEELYDHTSPAYKFSSPMWEPKQETDLVNHPPHYTSGGIETIDYMEAKSTPEEFKGHLRLTALKYLSRVGMKDDILQEYEKAEWYTKKLIETIKKERGML